MKRPVAPALLGLITGLALMFAVYTVYTSAGKQRYDHERAQVASRINTLQARFAESLGARMHLAPHMASFIRTEYNVLPDAEDNTEEELGVLAEDFLRHQPGVIRLLVAKDGIIQYVAPMEENELLLGKDLYLDPVVGILLKTGMDQDKPVITFTRADGGKMTLSWYVPVHFPETPGGTAGYLWGLSGVTIDLDQVLKESGFVGQDHQLQLAIATGDINDPATSWILGDRSLFTNDPVYADLRVQNLTW
ncbi:MAG: hypothetical protein DRQ37_03245, partial [Gammaproteobacteria bacterium]